MPSFSFSGSNKSIEDDPNESFFSVGERLSMLPGVLEPRINIFQNVNDTTCQTPKMDTSIKVKEEVTPSSDQENKPTNGFNKSLINEFNFKLSNDYSLSHNKGTKILSRASNFLKNERITDPIEHNLSIASVQTAFTVNPMFPSDIMGTAFDKAREDIELLVDDFRKNVSLIKQRDDVPTCKWDIKRHTLSEEFLKLREKPESKIKHVSKNGTNSNDAVKTQNIVNSLLATISQGPNYPVTTNNSYCFPIPQPFINNGVPLQHQQTFLTQNTFIQPSPQQQQSHLSTIPTNDIGIEMTEKQMESEEENDRKIIKILDRLARVEGPLP